MKSMVAAAVASLSLFGGIAHAKDLCEINTCRNHAYRFREVVTKVGGPGVTDARVKRDGAGGYVLTGLLNDATTLRTLESKAKAAGKPFRSTAFRHSDGTVYYKFVSPTKLWNFPDITTPGLESDSDSMDIITVADSGSNPPAEFPDWEDYPPGGGGPGEHCIEVIGVILCWPAG